MLRNSLDPDWDFWLDPDSIEFWFETLPVIVHRITMTMHSPWSLRENLNPRHRCTCLFVAIPEPKSHQFSHNDASFVGYTTSIITPLFFHPMNCIETIPSSPDTARCWWTPCCWGCGWWFQSYQPRILSNMSHKTTSHTAICQPSLVRVNQWRFRQIRKICSKKNLFNLIKLLPVPYRYDAK